MWIDSHCHLNMKQLEEFGPPSDIVRKAQEQGVSGMVSISCRITDDFPSILKIAQSHDNVWCSVGTHPHDAGLDAEQQITQQELCDLAVSDENIVAIGESGLDYYYDNSPRADQIASFRKHIRACVETDMPIVVHARDADQDTADILAEEGGGKLRGVMHCFSSGPELAQRALDMGLYISFSGIVTFKKAEELRAIAKTVPLDRILVETDAPYLAPVPYRGKTNQPAYVTHTGEYLAEFLGLPAEKFARQTSENFFRLFDRAKLV